MAVLLYAPMSMRPCEQEHCCKCLATEQANTGSCSVGQLTVLTDQQSSLQRPDDDEKLLLHGYHQMDGGRLTVARVEEPAPALSSRTWMPA
jgi:hypothetical protein